MILLERIKALCSANHISIQALEQKTGMSNGTIRNWDKFYPRADRLMAVADYFNVSMDWLMGRKFSGVSAEALEVAKYYDLSDDKCRALARLALIDEIRER